MGDIGVLYKFHKIDEIYSVKVNKIEDVIILANKVVNNIERILGELSSPKNKNLELSEDIVNLIELIRGEGIKEYIKNYKEVIYVIVAICLSKREETLCSIILHRLYKRGFSSNIADAFVQYCSKSVKYSKTEENSEPCVLLKNDSTILICCKILKYLSKFVYVERSEEECIICIDNKTYYSVIKKIVRIMFGSYLNRNNEWDYNSLSKLFHPFSNTYLPCLILYIIVDMLPEETRIRLLEPLSYFYADAELMKVVHVNNITYLSGCMSRILYFTRFASNEAVGILSKILTKAITSGLETLDPIIRLSAMTIAESYSIYLYNNSSVKDESILLKFEKETKMDSPNTLNLLAFKSKVVVNPNFANINRKDGEREEGRDEGKEVNKLEQRYIENGAEEENKSFLEYIFADVPSINMKTVDGYVKETWLKPPQHIVQCYERLLSKPARGDVDYECINSYGLDRVEEETVENKILRISQTLIYLPYVIRKRESILEKYAIPISEVLLKLDDLDLYREKIDEISRVYFSKIKDAETGSYPNEIISKDPEKLILVSLTLMTYYCPNEVIKHYASHLFNTDYTLSARITMILCIQYTSMAYNGSMDGDTLVKRVLCDGKRVEGGNNEMISISADRIKAGINTRKEGNVELHSNIREKEKENGMVHKSSNHVKSFSNKIIGYLMESLKTYSKKNISDRAPMDEEVSAAILETILIGMSPYEMEDETLKEMREMVSYFGEIPGGQKIKNTIKMIELVLSTHQIPHI